MSIKGQSNSRLVYSTETGRMCPDCAEPVTQCLCKNLGSMPKTDGVVRISLETKGRRGKGVTVVTGVPLPMVELGQLAKQLRSACGSGGTCKNGVIEIQGDHRNIVIQQMEKYNWVIKRTGG